MPDTTQSSPRGLRVVTIAHAHSGTDSYVILEWRESGVSGSVQYPVSDLNEAMGISIAQDRETAQRQVDDANDRIVEYTSEHLSIKADGLAVKPGLGPCGFFEMNTRDSYVVVPLALPGMGGGGPATITVEYDGIISELPDRPALLDLRRFSGIGRLSQFEREQLPFSPDTTSHTVTRPTFSTTEHLITATNVGAKNLYTFGRRTVGKALRAAGLRS